MARQTPVLIKSFPCDTAIVLNTVVVASGANAGNVKIPAAAGAVSVIGVTQQNTDNALYAPILLEGIAQCRFLTGVAINFGDIVKVGDVAGRVTKAIPAAPGANVRGQVGIAMQSLAAGVATDTLIDVLLQPGTVSE